MQAAETLLIKPAVFSREMRLMGNNFGISVVAENEHRANECIDEAVAEISRIEKLLTTFNKDSQTNRINANAGINPVEVDDEVFNLIERSIKISSLTQGAFDITYGSIDKSLWNFDTGMKQLPDTATAKRSVRLIDYKNIILDKGRKAIFLKEKGMRIGFGGIGKGYAAERAKQLLKQKGVIGGVVNASGDLTAWGTQPNGKKWTIGLTNPDKPKDMLSYMDITDLSVATSGNYEKYIEIDGKRYSHTIDPRTGLPVTGVKSVTIITTNAELADAMATPVTIMGVEAGLNLINQMNGVGAIIIDDYNRIYTSDNIHL